MKGLPKRPNGDLCSACKWIGGRTYPLTTTGRISSCVCAKPTRDTPRKKTNIHIRRIKTSNGILAILEDRLLFPFNARRAERFTFRLMELLARSYVWKGRLEF